MNGNDYKVFDNPEDLFANKDARLYGTVIYPGTQFRNSDVDIQAGVAVWNAPKGEYEYLLTDPCLGKQVYRRRNICRSRWTDRSYS